MKLSELKKHKFKRYVRVDDTILDLTKSFVKDVKVGHGYCGEEPVSWIEIIFTSGKTLCLAEEYCDDERYVGNNIYEYLFADEPVDLIWRRDIIRSRKKYCAPLEKITLVTSSNIVKCREMLHNHKKCYDIFSEKGLNYNLVLSVFKDGSTKRFVKKGN